MTTQSSVALALQVLADSGSRYFVMDPAGHVKSNMTVEATAAVGNGKAPIRRVRTHVKKFHRHLKVGQKYGSLSNYVQPFIKDDQPKDQEICIPRGQFTVKQVRGVAAGMSGKAWGLGTYETRVDRSNAYVIRRK